MSVPKTEAVDFGGNCGLGVCFLCLICFCFYVYLSLVFSVCFHLWVCLLVWCSLPFSFPFFPSFCECVYVSLCDFVSFCFYPLSWGSACSFFLFFFFFLFFCAMWLAGSWCSGQMLGLSLQGGRAESRILDHQRPPGPM